MSRKDYIEQGAHRMRKDVLKAWETMARERTCSHSLNILRNGHSPVTLMMLFVPARLDQEIYAALKPIFDRELGVGTLVEPNTTIHKV